MIEQANIVTNRAELLAWTEPREAIAAAIETQQDLGAQHELGKAYTALAVAQLRLGQYEQSAVSFQTAIEALERARYRSGRARAELFRALLYAHAGDRDTAARAARWSVAELIEADVYPTLIMMAGQFLHAIGVRDEYVEAAARRARGQIQAPDSPTAFEARTAALVAALLGETR